MPKAVNRKMNMAVALLGCAALLAGQGVAGDVGIASKKLGFTNKNIQANPFGSCPMRLGYSDGVSDGGVWQFDLPYPFVNEVGDCSAPWPNTNVYAKGQETVIAVNEPENNGGTGPSTCYECAKWCNSVDECNAWVFCVNADGCKHSGGVTGGFSCTLKNISPENAGMQQLMYDGTFSNNAMAPPSSLVSSGTSGRGSDFVSGVCVPSS
mmetsp:Transcript_4283/g.10999  ORF Transcript_4283/g.10999 Transcript_4283/m.10999 type:complete len:209 (-) Transcript_4283:87-713(-)